MNTALSRVEASRSRLRLAMIPPPASVDPLRNSPSWRDRVAHMPLVGPLMESVHAWWTNHPLRPAVQVAGEASNTIVQPLADKNPWLLVLAAALLGAGLAWSRPWRWIFRSALFAGLIPQIAKRAVTSMPIESWLKVLGAGISRPPARSPVPDPAAQAATA